MTTVPLHRRAVLAASICAMVLASCGGPVTAVNPEGTLRCVGEGDEPSPGPLTTVRVSDIGLVGDAPTYLAIDEGYFAANGIEIESQPFRSAVDAIPFLGQGRLDVATGTLSAAFYNGLGSGLDIRVVADSARVAPGTGSHLSLVVGAESADDIDDYDDLRGRRVAINAPAGGLEVQLEQALANGGLTLGDVDVIHLQFPEMIAAFTSGNVDVAIVPEPFLSIGLDVGAFVELASVGEFYPDHQVSVLMFSGEFIEREDLAVAYLCAYLRGARRYLEAIGGGDEASAALANTLLEHTPLEDPELIGRLRFHTIDPSGALNRPSIEQDIAHYLDSGHIDTAPPLDEFIDLRILDRAVAMLDAP